MDTVFNLAAITKRFAENVALDGVDLTLRAGSVHGVLGENGAGKTTLMRIAAGLVRPDAGTVTIEGRPLPAGSPAEAARAGLAMVHQHFMLVPTLTVAENFLIGRREWGQVVSRRRVAARVTELGGRTGLDVDPAARVV
ncbi:MAG: ATP-binding cassette domain-containing protein [Planctomycetes bacterium]|nr:ATP-binding cassette domain-containing protein [Planctomycetota bacterium]